MKKRLLGTAMAIGSLCYQRTHYTVVTRQQIESIDPCLMMYHKQWLTPSQSPGHSFASSCPTLPAPTRTIRLRPQDQKTLASHDQAIASRAASRTDEEMTMLNCNRNKTLVPSRGGIALWLLVAKPFDAPDTHFTTGHEQPLAHPWSQGLYTLPNYPTRIAATGTMSHWRQDQINVENASLWMPSQRDGQDISSTMRPNDSWCRASPPDQGHINKVGLPRNDMHYRCTEWETSLVMQVSIEHCLWTQTMTTEPDCLPTIHPITARSARHHCMVQILIRDEDPCRLSNLRVHLITMSKNWDMSLHKNFGAQD